MDLSYVTDDITAVLHTEEQILARITELAAELDLEYAGKDVVLVGVLGGAAMVTVDLARALSGHVEIGWMAIRSYGSGAKSSGSIRLLKALDVDITGRHVIIVEGVIDSGLTAKWLLNTLAQRDPASIAICTLFRKPNAPEDLGAPTYIGFEIGAGMIVGYGMDYAGRYRNLRGCAVLAPHVYERRKAAATID